MELREIRIRQEIDPEPDLSYLGEFTDKLSSIVEENGQVFVFPNYERPNAGRDEFKYIKTGRDHTIEAYVERCKGDNYLVSRALAEQHFLEDMERLESHGDTWHLMGVWAEADVIIDGTPQTLRSLGCWGIESDSGEMHLREIMDQEIADLGGVLKELALSEFEGMADDAIENALIN